MIKILRILNKCLSKFLFLDRKEERAGDKLICDLFNGKKIYNFKEVGYYIK